MKVHNIEIPNVIQTHCKFDREDENEKQLHKNMNRVFPFIRRIRPERSVRSPGFESMYGVPHVGHIQQDHSTEKAIIRGHTRDHLLQQLLLRTLARVKVRIQELLSRHEFPREN
jgi:hypothetical protein